MGKGGDFGQDLKHGRFLRIPGFSGNASHPISHPFPQIFPEFPNPENPEFPKSPPTDAWNEIPVSFPHFHDPRLPQFPLPMTRAFPVTPGATIPTWRRAPGCSKGSPTFQQDLGGKGSSTIPREFALSSPKSMDSIPNFPAGSLRAPAHPER